jgi:hypothetical protein
MSSRFLTNRRAFCFVQAPSPRDIFPAQLDFAGSARWFRHRGIGRAKKVSGSCFFHEPLTRNAEVDPAGPLRLRGGRIIWVSLRWDALLRPLARLLASAQLDVVVAPLDAVAERLGVVGLPLSAHFLYAQGQADVLALQPAPASQQLQV